MSRITRIIKQIRLDVLPEMAQSKITRTYLKKKEAEILRAQWIDGPPKDTGKGKFLLVFRQGDDYCERIWNGPQDRLSFITDMYGPVVKHMRIPEYE